MVVNTAGLLAEDLCLALTKAEGRVVTALTQPPGLRCQGHKHGLGPSFGFGLGRLSFQGLTLYLAHLT